MSKIVPSILWRLFVAILQLLSIFIILSYVSEVDLANFYYITSFVVISFVFVSSSIDYKINIAVSNQNLKRKDFYCFLIISYPVTAVLLSIGYIFDVLLIVLFSWIILMMINQVIKNYINILGFSSQTIFSMFFENIVKVLLIYNLVMPHGASAITLFFIQGLSLVGSLVYLSNIIIKESVFKTFNYRKSFKKISFLLKENMSENIDVTAASLMNSLYVNLPKIALGWLGLNKELVVLGALQSIISAGVGIISSFLKIEFVMKIYKNSNFIKISILSGLITMILGLITLLIVEVAFIEFLPKLLRENFGLAYFAFISEFYIVFLSILCVILLSLRKTKSVNLLHIFLLIISIIFLVPSVVYLNLFIYFLIGSIITLGLFIYLLLYKGYYEELKRNQKYQKLNLD